MPSRHIHFPPQAALALGIVGRENVMKRMRRGSAPFVWVIVAANSVGASLSASVLAFKIRDLRAGN